MHDFCNDYFSQHYINDVVIPHLPTLEPDKHIFMKFEFVMSLTLCTNMSREEICGILFAADSGERNWNESEFGLHVIVACML